MSDEKDPADPPEEKAADPRGMMADLDPDEDKGDPPKEKTPEEIEAARRAALENPDGPYRPDELPDHLRGENDQQTIDNVLKAYKGLRKKMSDGADALPDKVEDYSFEAPEGVEIDLTSEANVALMGAVAAAAHANGIGLKAAQGFVGEVMKALPELAKGVEAAEPAMPDLTEEYEKLGGRDKAMPMIQGLNRWGKGLVEKGRLNDEEFEEFQIMAGTALGAKVMRKLMHMTGEPMIPLEGSERSGGKLSREELYALRNDARYNTDPAYRRDVEDKFRQAFG